jgi:HPt (histidine-containing phosphotransfer) domain-containing protein
MLSFDKEKLNEYFSDEKDILGELIVDFFEELPVMLSPIKESIESEDMDKMQISAHTLKGAVSNFFAPNCVAFSHDLEKMGKDKSFNLEVASETYDKLEGSLQRLEGELKSFASEF